MQQQATPTVWLAGEQAHRTRTILTSLASRLVDELDELEHGGGDVQLAMSLATTLLDELEELEDR